MTRPNIEELDRLWEEATAKRGAAQSEPDLESMLRLIVGANAAYGDKLHNTYPELSAYVKALEKEREWQPIETAPRDGAEVLLYWPYWTEVPITGRFSGDNWECEMALVVSQGPTHWMPIPPVPPKETP